MSELPYLNLGCGSHFDTRWVNVDFSTTGEGVIAHNLLNGIPFGDNTFEVVYHSHMLEHLPRNKASEFIAECYRVLKPGGILRIAVPDLEQIINNYSRLLALGKQNPGDQRVRDDYDWMMIELYDQAVRNEGGGGMIDYLSRKVLTNEDFIFQRIGYEGYMLRQSIVTSFNTPPPKVSFARKVYRAIRWNIAPRNYKRLFLSTFFPKEYKLMLLGKFRQEGEIHQWMYDIYSLGKLLGNAGFKNVAQKTFDSSAVPDWRSFGLDEVNDKVRKPDSLFVEAVK